MCGSNRRRISKGDTWCHNEEVTEAVLKKKNAHKVMCWNNTEEYKRRHGGMKNKAMREKAEEVLIE